MKCPNCGSQNDESRYECWKCGRQFLGRSALADIKPPPDYRNQGIEHKTAVTRRATWPPRYASTTAALAGLILLIVGLALHVYYGERLIDIMNTGYNIDEWQSLSDISHALGYFWTLGDLAVILAIVLVIQSLTNKQQEGWSATLLRRISQVNVKRLLLLGLAAMMASLILLVCLSEFPIGSDGDMINRLSNSVSYLSQAAWILVTSAILLVANGLRNGDGSGNEEVET